MFPSEGEESFSLLNRRIDIPVNGGRMQYRVPDYMETALTRDIKTANPPQCLEFAARIPADGGYLGK